MKRASIACVSLVAVNAVSAAGYTSAAAPTRVDVVRAEGFMIYGAFGNPGTCTFADYLFVRSDHPQYKQMYAAALIAMASKQKILAYVPVCQPVTWYSVAANTFNVVDASSSLAISD